MLTSLLSSWSLSFALSIFEIAVQGKVYLFLRSLRSGKADVKDEIPVEAQVLFDTLFFGK